jgi:N-acetylglucosamine-6-phosphate deacetylase
MNLSAARILVSSGVKQSCWLTDASITTKDGLVVGINRVDRTNPACGIFTTRADGIDCLVPGFVDMHCHGGGGGSFTSGDQEQARTAAAFHAQHGSTSIMASLVTAPHSELVQACGALAPLVSEGVVAGIHIEGPYLSELRCGAQDPRWLRDPNQQEINELFAAARGTIRQMTIAPELPGAFEAIETITRNGAIAAIGHTNANPDTIYKAIAAGARIATHLCNAMPSLHHRELTGTLCLLTSEDVVCELIADGHHLSVPMFQTLTRTAGRGRWALITDAIGATGLPDGLFSLGSQEVLLQNGIARLNNKNRSDSHENDTAPLAGSVLTMDQALRNAIIWGTERVEAIEAASLVPSIALGLDHRVGRLAVGSPADIVGLNERNEVVAVWKKGIRVR